MIHNFREERLKGKRRSRELFIRYFNLIYFVEELIRLTSEVPWSYLITLGIYCTVLIITYGQ
jgi:hypothetical protein